MSKAPATVPLIGDYRIALWSTQRPRLFTATGVELKLRSVGGVLVARLSLGDDGHKRQVSQTVPRLLLAARLILPGPGDRTLVSTDGTCSIASLRWLARGDVSRLKRHGQPLAGLPSDPARLSASAAACVLANDTAAKRMRTESNV